MTARPTTVILAASLALAPALYAQGERGGSDRSGGGARPVLDGDGGGGRAHASAEGRHPSPSSGGGTASGSSAGGSGVAPWFGGPSSPGSPGTTPAQRRHPRAGTGSGSGGGYYPGYPGYPGWGGGYYPPYYWGAWWPYGSLGYWGGYYSGYWGSPWGGGAVTHYVHRETSALRVLVDPSEARVYVDGYYAGTVDDFDGLFQRLNVSPGRHEIAFKLEGFKTHRVKVYAAPDATLKLHHDMQKGEGETVEDLARGAGEREATPEREKEERWDEDEARARREEAAGAAGHLRFLVRPDDASVYVDGAFRGSAAEVSSLRLAPGRHRVELVRPGYRTLEREMEIAPGETAELRVEMERPSI